MCVNIMLLIHRDKCEDTHLCECVFKVVCVCLCVYIQSFENIDFSVTVLLFLPSHLAGRKEIRVPETHTLF